MYWRGSLQFGAAVSQNINILSLLLNLCMYFVIYNAPYIGSNF